MEQKVLAGLPKCAKSSFAGTEEALEDERYDTNTPLRVTMVTGSLSRRAGGLFQSVRNLSQALARQGVAVRVVGLRDADTERDLDAWGPLSPLVVDVSGPTALGYAPGLSLHLQDTDIVHQHGIWQLWSRAVTGFGRRGATIVSPRGMLDPWARANAVWKKRIAWAGWERRNLLHATCLHALAEAEAEAIDAVLPGAPIVVIPNGVTVGAKPSVALREVTPKVCLFMARIHPKKGLSRLLAQWAVLPTATRAAWRLEIAGPDEIGLRDGLEAQVRAVGLAESVRFLGALHGEAKATAFARASAFVLPSYSEGLPMAVLEAWSAGLPVFMTRACNLPEGFDVGAAHEIGDDPADLAAGLARADLPEMGNRGRALVTARFAWDQIAARHIEVYFSMAHGNSRPESSSHV